VILRVAAKTNCGYEWAQHSSARAQAASLTDDLTRLTVDSLSGWTGWDATVLSAVDQICEHRYISDATWRTLSESYTDKQLIEFTFLCAQYVALATVLNTLGVPIDGE
jgi:alkylhydroperoxidase family enzyme